MNATDQFYARLDAGIFARERLGFTPDAAQMRVLRSTAKRGILNCSRQWGKSTVVAVKALHRALFHPRALVLVASPSGRQSAEFIRKAAAFARQAELKGARASQLTVTLPNGSRIVGVPDVEGTVRGFSAVDLLLIDEAARVSDDLYYSVRPMLAVSGGELWMMSTPCGRRGFFWEEWQNTGGEVEKISVPATQCPRIPQEFLEEERQKMTAEWFRQEYLCEFLGDSKAVFDPVLIDQAFDNDLTPLWPIYPCESV